MKNKKIIMILVSMLIASSFSFNGTNFTNAEIKFGTSQPTLNADPFIVIDDDSDFSIYPGYGNETHPYIIEGLVFESSTTADIAINITGTTANFLIRNNEFKSSSPAGQGLMGIYLKDVAPNTARIEGNEMRSFERIIWADNVPGVTIKDNTCYRIGITGYYIMNCPSATIENNIINGVVIPSRTDSKYSTPSIKDSVADRYGAIYCHNCSDLIIRNNYSDLDGKIAGSGFNVEHSERILIENNILKNQNIHITEYEHLEKSGLWMENITDGTIFNNTLEYTEKGSLSATDCQNLMILNNTFGESETYGIVLITTSHCNITNNIIQDHPYYAIDLSAGSDYNTIHHNKILNNRLNSQARDSGIGNVWYDNTTNEGNWWVGDWYGGPYEIDGTAASSDPYPLGEPLVVPEFSIKIVTLLALMLLSLAVIPLIRRKKN